MKQSKILWLLISLAALIGCNKSAQIQISGTTGDTITSHVRIEKFDASNSVFIDSIKVKKDGNFHYKFSAESSEFYLLKTKNQQCILVLKPSDKIHLNFNASNKYGYGIEGSEDSKDIQTINYAWQQTKSQLSQIKKLYYTIQDDQEKLELSNRYDSLLKVQRKENIKYIIEHPTSLVSLLALFQKVTPEEYLHNRLTDLQYYKILTDSLAPLYPQMGFIKSLQQNFLKFNRQYQTQKLVSSTKNISIGIPELTIHDTENNEIQLTSIDSKLLLLSFWSVKNNASIEFNEKLKPIYSKYKHKGFEIMAINTDLDTIAWQKTVRFAEYDWINVNERNPNGSYAASVYNVSELPDYYLIDLRKKDVLGRWLSFDDLSRKLEYHLK